MDSDFRFKRFFCILLSFFIVNCDHKQNQNNEILFVLLKPSLGMFGDSIMAFWPAEEQLKPFVIVKNAFPIRSSSEILEVVKKDQLHYTACLYNSGVNDFLGNYAPEDFQIQNTINVQLQTIAILQNRCEHILVLNTWYVEFPWPSEAVSRLNKAMKENILTVPRLDSESLIHKSDLLDGGHLTDIGYNKLAKFTLEHFGTKIPWMGLLPK